MLQTNPIIPSVFPLLDQMFCGFCFDANVRARIAKIKPFIPANKILKIPKITAVNPQLLFFVSSFGMSYLGRRVL